MDTEPHLEVLTQHLAGHIVVPCTSAAAEVNVLMDSGLGITAMCGGVDRGPATPAGDDENRVDTSVGWACACGDVVGQRL